MSTDNNPLVSVVLPVYNGEKYLELAIESIIAQTNSNWELLIVDDGSKDASSSICDDYATRDTRIRVFHQPNGGVNVARAKGIDNASGTYLTFIDADDAFIPEALDYMLSMFLEEFDLIAYGEKNISLNQKDYIKYLWSGGVGLPLWGKMFRTDSFKKTDYHLDGRLVMGEDLLLNSMYALSIHKARITTKNCYLVNRNNDSSVTANFKHNWEYEKYYFCKVNELFLSKCLSMPFYDDIEILVNKCWLNAMKYVMLDGGKINYSDIEFKKVRDFFLEHKKEYGPSEKLVFWVKSGRLYRMVMRAYINIMAKYKR